MQLPPSFPRDEYEVEASPFTKRLLNHHSAFLEKRAAHPQAGAGGAGAAAASEGGWLQHTWGYAVCICAPGPRPSSAQSAQASPRARAFGYLRVAADQRRVVMVVLLQGYEDLLRLLHPPHAKRQRAQHQRGPTGAPEARGAVRWQAFFSSLPAYYYAALRDTLGRPPFSIQTPDPRSFRLVRAPPLCPRLFAPRLFAAWPICVLATFSPPLFLPSEQGDARKAGRT